MILPNALTHTHVNPALIVSEVRTLAETYENGNEERREGARTRKECSTIRVTACY